MSSNDNHDKMEMKYKSLTQSRKELDEQKNLSEPNELTEEFKKNDNIKRLENKNCSLDENILQLKNLYKMLERNYDNLNKKCIDLMNDKLQVEGLTVAKQFYEQIIKDLKQKLQKFETYAQITNDQIILNLRNNLQDQLNEKERVIRELKQKLNEETSKYQSALETKTHDPPNDIATLQDQLNEKEKDIRDLVEINRELKEEASKYQSALGAATNVRLGNDDQNHSVQLKQDILDLQRTLEHYVTNLKEQNSNKRLIKAILQREVLEQIFNFSIKYGFYKDENYSLETDIDSKAQELLLLIKNFSETRVGTDEVSNVATIKIRQQIYRILGNRGFSDIISPQDKSISSHNFIHIFSHVLNEKINKYRQINDIEKKKEVEKLAQQLIRDVCRIFWFRFLVQEPELQNKFIESNTLINPDLMDGNWEDVQLEKICVGLCYFPLVGRDLNSNSNYKVITPAKIIARSID
ncbi:14531_t:CDS:2 [Funneliformis mosseae]|uniref:14531_t:CDS:1 n=1 Tax=Funneliformis mosseae TaxID=27381 RepID=A0A9N9GGV2_FUNMO|nr:14531_t:CDS:2 [Funneliformis mosseae]